MLDAPETDSGPMKVKINGYSQTGKPCSSHMITVLSSELEVVRGKYDRLGHTMKQIFVQIQDAPKIDAKCCPDGFLECHSTTIALFQHRDPKL